MNKHLQLVRDYHERFAIKQSHYPETAPLSDMDIVMYQALLMDSGSATFKAMTSGDLAKYWLVWSIWPMPHSHLSPAAVTMSSPRRLRGARTVRWCRL